MSTTENKVCPTHGPYVQREVTFAGRTMMSGCHRCAIEHGREKFNAEVSEVIREGRANRRKAVLENLKAGSGIPERFATKGFDNYQVASADQESALKVAKNFAIKFEKLHRDIPGLIFSGTTGTGKTHLSCAIGNHILLEGKSVLFASAMKVMGYIKATYSRNAKRTEEQAYQDMLDIDLLIIDEVGVQRGTDEERIILTEIINNRYADKKPTILLTNLTTVEIQALLGERIIERFKEGGFVIECKWASHRARRSAA